MNVKMNLVKILFLQKKDIPLIPKGPSTLTMIRTCTRITTSNLKLAFRTEFHITQYSMPLCYVFRNTRNAMQCYVCNRYLQSSIKLYFTKRPFRIEMNLYACRRTKKPERSIEIGINGWCPSFLCFCYYGWNETRM